MSISPEQTVEELIAYFLALKGIAGAEREFRNRFDVMALQRNLKALGTFGYQTTARRNPVVHPIHSPHAPLRPQQPGAPAPLQPHVGTARGARGRVSVNGGRSSTRGANGTAAWYNRLVLPPPTGNRSGHALRNIDPSVPRSGADPRSPGDDRVVRIRGRRGVRDAKPLRLPRRRRRSSAWSGWLNETGLALHGIHAPITDRLSPGDKWGAVISNAVSDPARRQAAVREAEAALNIAKRIPTDVFVVHLGTPDRARRREQPRGGVPQHRGDLRACRTDRRPGRGRTDPERDLGRAVAGDAARSRPRRATRRHLPRLRSCVPHGRRAGHDRDGVGASDHDARARQPSASATIIWCPSTAASTGMRR